MPLRWQGLEGEMGLGTGQLAVELSGHDHRRACLGASVFGGASRGLLHLQLTLYHSRIVRLLGQEAHDICLDSQHSARC
jgi:hypothetical protein